MMMLRRCALRLPSVSSQTGRQALAIRFIRRFATTPSAAPTREVIVRKKASAFQLDASKRPNLLAANRNKTKKNIVLMGPPGSGKSTVGKIIAAKLGMPFLDVDDDHLEKVWGTTVAAKLAELGDDAFLDLEGQTLQQLTTDQPTVISLSGSNPLHAASMEYISKDGVIVYLDVDKNDILARCASMKVDRIVGMGSKSLSDILDWRLRVYENSYDLRVIVTQNEAPESIAEKLLKEVQKSQAYVSTRGYKGNLDFLDVVRRGLAPDRGLFVSEGFTPFSLQELKRLIPLPYQERALRVMERFPLGSLHPSQLRDMIYAAYSSFTHPKGKILPLRHLEGQQYLMETFHGPTASFKDLSLQLTPRLVQASLSQGDTVGLLVATSGDTGTAALDGFSRVGNIPIIVLYPKDGVSLVQKLQMVTQPGPVCVIGVDGDFDFCQNMVKDILNNPELAEEFAGIVPGLQLSSANSINFGRFLPQVVFSVSAYLDMAANNIVRFGDLIDVSVPTGNFGNLLGAVYAKRLGVPLGRLVSASNENNVLSDFFRTGQYDLRNRSFKQTVSPSIDILVSSNLERFIHLVSGGDSELVKSLFSSLSTNKHFSVQGPLLEKIQQEVIGSWCSERACLETVRQLFQRTRVMLDTHTAVAKHVADQLTYSSDYTATRPDSSLFARQENTNRFSATLAAVEKRYLNESRPCVIASTAHYGKFPDAILQAVQAKFVSPFVKQGKVVDEAGHVSACLDQLDVLDPVNPMHPKLNLLPDKAILHDRTCPKDPKAIVDEIRTFLSSFQASRQQQ